MEKIAKADQRKRNKKPKKRKAGAAMGPSSCFIVKVPSPLSPVSRTWLQDDAAHVDVLSAFPGGPAAAAHAVTANSVIRFECLGDQSLSPAYQSLRCVYARILNICAYMCMYMYSWLLFPSLLLVE